MKYSHNWSRVLWVGLAGVCLMASPCGPLPLKDPVTVPLSPKAGGGYERLGKRIAFGNAEFRIAVEPLETAEVQRFFTRRTQLTIDPFHIPDRPALQIFRVTVVNTGKDDLSFNATFITLESEGKLDYHMTPVEATHLLREVHTDVDIGVALQKALYDAATVVNPGRYVSRLLVFYPLHEDSRSLTLLFSNLGLPSGSVDVAFPFEVVERTVWGRQDTPEMRVTGSVSEQKD